MNLKEIQIDEIKVVGNVRTTKSDKNMNELMRSIKENGLLEPIGVRVNIKDSTHKYELMYGFRRLSAIQKLGWKTISAVVLEDVDDEDHIVMNTVENIQRAPNSLVEIGRVCMILQNRYSLSPEQIAIRLSMPHQRVQQVLALYKQFPKEILEEAEFMTNSNARKSDKIPVGHLVLLASLKAELKLTDTQLKEIIHKVKKEGFDQDKLRQFVKIYLALGDIDSALEKMNDIYSRAIHVLVNSKAEKKAMKEAGIDKLNEFYKAIITGKIEGKKDLLY